MPVVMPRKSIRLLIEQRLIYVEFDCGILQLTHMLHNKIQILKGMKELYGFLQIVKQQ